MAGKRRGNSEGTVVERSDGRWMGQISLENGKRKTIYAKTQREALQKLAALRRDRDKGLPVMNDRQTVEQYLKAWLDTMKPPRIRESTWIRAESHLRIHAIPAIGKVRLSKLNRMHLQQLYAKCLADGLSPTTVNHLHGVLHQALDHAMRSDLVPRNVAALADPPHVEKREMQIYTPEQVDTLLEAAKGHRLEALIVLTVASAMRAGELLALRWTHIDMSCEVLHVKRTRTRVAKGYTDGKPKTDSGMRDIKLIPRALEALRAHKRRQAEERLRIGDAWHDEDRVFPSTIGTALDPANLTKQWYKIIALAGLPEIHFHDLRHGAASWLIAQGVPITDVSKMLGHADASITLRFYAHALPNSQDRVATALALLLRQPHDPSCSDANDA